VTRWRLLPRARADIDGIWDYTAREYGIEQAVAYLRAIEAAVIAHERAQSCDHIRPGYWRIKAGSHVIFFHREGDEVIVVRILHERMDFAGRLA
jgi:toxin ParE1/3/4